MPFQPKGFAQLVVANVLPIGWHSAWLSSVLLLLQVALWNVSLRKTSISRDDIFQVRAEV